MAEFGSHLTSATANDSPSFFDVLAQESLMLTLQPAMKYLIKILAEHNPARYGALHRYSSEIYTSLDLLLQHHFLSTTSASFAENFYSLKRVSTSTTVQQNYLPAWRHTKSLVFLVLVPYLKLKLEALYERLKGDDMDQPRDDSRGGKLLRLRTIFVGVFPLLHMMWESWILYYQLRYLIHKSDCHSPFLKLAGVRLKYMSSEDIRDQLHGVAQANHIKSWSAGLVQYPRQAIRLLAISVSHGLAVSIFFLQFLEWWYVSQDNKTRLAVTSLPIPNPPEVKQLEATTDPTLCPLCHRLRTNDTALATSGYVFCYLCIYSFVKGHRCCPITSYPTELTHLVKLYPDF